VSRICKPAIFAIFTAMVPFAAAEAVVTAATTTAAFAKNRGEGAARDVGRHKRGDHQEQGHDENAAPPADGFPVGGDRQDGDNAEGDDARLKRADILAAYQAALAETGGSGSQDPAYLDAVASYKAALTAYAQPGTTQAQIDKALADLQALDANGPDYDPALYDAILNSLSPIDPNLPLSDNAPLLTVRSALLGAVESDNNQPTGTTTAGDPQAAAAKVWTSLTGKPADPNSRGFRWFMRFLGLGSLLAPLPAEGDETH
jgi:hypothetical protein